MSHRHGSEGSIAEPNLTPLLDVVLQLLMFFMMCVNFVTEQVNEDIKLPFAQSARPMDKGEQDVLFLNIDDHGQLLVLGKEDPLNMLRTKYYLRDQYQTAPKTCPRTYRTTPRRPWPRMKRHGSSPISRSSCARSTTAASKAT